MVGRCKGECEEEEEEGWLAGWCAGESKEENEEGWSVGVGKKMKMEKDSFEKVRKRLMNFP